MRPDVTQTMRHIRFLYEGFLTEYPDGKIQIQPLDPMERETPSSIYFSISEVGFTGAADFAIRMNQKGYNVYIGVNPRKPDTQGYGSNADIEISHFHFIDCDTSESVAAFDAATDKPAGSLKIITGDTPSQRIQVYYELETPSRNMIAWRNQQLGLITHFSSDASIHDPRRIMRLAGCISRPSAKKQAKGYTPYLVRIDEGYEATETPIEAENLRAAFPYIEKPKAAPKLNFKEEWEPASKYDSTLRHFSVDDAIKKVKSGEEWHNNILRLIGHWVRIGRSDAQILAHAESLTLEGFTVEQTQQQMQVMIDGARQKGWGTPNPLGSNPTSLDLNSKSLANYLDDDTPMPSDLLAPRILTPGGMLVIGGAPKVGKSDFVIHLTAHCAAGLPFLGFIPARPLRIYCLQAEMPHDYMRERVRRIALDPSVSALARDNIYFSNRFVRRLDDDALQTVAGEIKKLFGETPPDIIVIDPLANVFYSENPVADENNNAAMLAMMQRLQRLLDNVNPNGAMIVCHHTGKIRKEDIKGDPFNALRGASSLRGYYSTGMLLFKEDEQRIERTLFIERRYGLDDVMLPKVLVKSGGAWQEALNGRPLVKGHYQGKLDAERNRKRDIICGLLYDEAAAGRVYTANSFAEQFENKLALGSNTTIRDRIKVLQTKGYVKSHCPRGENGKNEITAKWGYLCVQGMRRGEISTIIDTETGEIMDKTAYILPTHYKCPQTGVKLEVTDKHDWPQDDEKK